MTPSNQVPNYSGQVVSVNPRLEPVGKRSMDTMNQNTSPRPTPLILFITALLLLSALPLRAEVAARLSSPTTGIDQPVQLTLEMKGEESGTPDLSVLDKEFEILGRATQQSVSIINGSVSSKRSLILTLLPRREGSLTIPAITIGDQVTAPLTLEVAHQASATGATQQKLARVEMSLDKTSAYPEEEVILTLKLFQAAGVRGEHLDQPVPSLGDTRLQLLDESSYGVERDGQPYRVLESNYGLYAYQTGSLKIAPVSFRGRSGGGSIFSLLDAPFNAQPQTSRIVRAESDPVTLEVKPVPAAFTGDHWLPAKSIQLAETGIDSNGPIVAGKPLTRRIMLIADGLLSSQLPVITPQAPDGVKVYEDQPQLQDTPRRTGVSSSRESVVTLIPTRAGEFTLPGIEIPWWNTETGKQEIARLPALTLQVAPGAVGEPPPAVATPAQAQAEASSPNPSPQTATTAAVAESDEIHWLVWLLVAAWFATLAGWWISHRRHRSSPPATEPTEVPPSADERALATAIDALVSAYRDKETEAARSAWLQWAQCQWPKHPPNNLTRLAARCEPHVAEAVIALEKALYSPGIETGWAEAFDPTQLRAASEQTPTPRPVDEALLPLNP